MQGQYGGVVPYLFFDDAAAAMQWYGRVFGFEEISRWPGADGVVANAEMRIGTTELWLDGSGKRADTDPRPHWLGVWVDDVDAVCARVRAAGVSCDDPVDRDFGVRMLNVADPFGYLWGFIRRLHPEG